MISKSPKFLQNDEYQKKFRIQDKNRKITFLCSSTIKGHK